jgi:hypothetical protein
MSPQRPTRQRDFFDWLNDGRNGLTAGGTLECGEYRRFGFYLAG